MDSSKRWRKSTGRIVKKRGTE